MSAIFRRKSRQPERQWGLLPASYPGFQREPANEVSRTKNFDFVLINFPFEKKWKPITDSSAAKIENLLFPGVAIFRFDLLVDGSNLKSWQHLGAPLAASPREGSRVQKTSLGLVT